eukprot:gene10879-12875_t
MGLGDRVKKIFGPKEPPAWMTAQENILKKQNENHEALVAETLARHQVMLSEEEEREASVTSPECGPEMEFEITVAASVARPSIKPGVIKCKARERSDIPAAVNLALGLPRGSKVKVYIRGVGPLLASFSDNALANGVQLDVELPPPSFQEVLDDLAELNPHLDKAAIGDRARFLQEGILEAVSDGGYSGSAMHKVVTFSEGGGRGKLRDWYLADEGIAELPESFGFLEFEGELQLDGNELTSLPESFGNIRVGTMLSVSRNKLTSLPKNFGKVTACSLSLYDNQISELPESWKDLKDGIESCCVYIHCNPVGEGLQTQFPGFKTEY